MKQAGRWMLLAGITAVFFGAGRVLAARAGSWLTAEAGVLILVLAACLVLPGPAVLWAELLGTAAGWPVMWRALPFGLFCAGPAFVPPVVHGVICGVLTLLAATLGPMLLLLLFGDWLDARGQR